MLGREEAGLVSRPMEISMKIYLTVYDRWGKNGNERNDTYALIFLKEL